MLYPSDGGQAILLINRLKIMCEQAFDPCARRASA